MTSQRFERDLPVLLEELYVAGTPDYRDDLLRQTARTRQRPAWSLPTRWIPMDVATRRLPFAPLPVRALGVVALILILAVAAVIVGVGSRQRVPDPFGPAHNGPIAYAQNDAIYARDSIAAPEHLLIGGDGTKNGFWGYSPDGTRILFSRTTNGFEYLMVADADGRNQRQILDARLDDAYGAWAPDSRTVAISTAIGGVRSLLLAHVDGSPAVTVEVGDLRPTDMAWRPPSGAQLLFRANHVPAGAQDLYLVNADGTGLHSLNIRGSMIFGADWDVSGPTWSPTGDRIAYNEVEPTSNERGGTFRVHVVQPDGTGQVTLPGPADRLIHEAWPVWSPDGRSIAVEHFTFGDPGDDWLAVLPSDGSAPARDLLPRAPANPDGGLVKSWSPDGTRVIAYNKGSGKLWSIDPVSGQVEEVPWPAVDLPDIRRLP
jgi:WD40-like Beta Propeller Repeat